ncbi:MAG: PKD domain-containing protein, partial [Candidatus Eisenbacteria bacterium]
LTITQSGKPASLTFTAQAAGPSPRTATITGTPAAGSAGSYSIVFTVNDGSGATNATASSTTVLTITGGNHPPTLTQPANMNVDEGKTADQIVTGSDQDGDALTFTKASGPLFMTVTTTNNTTGNVHLAPGFSDAGSYTASVQVSDGKGGTDARSFTITVNPVNRGPTANPGGPYNGVVGVPVNFDGTGSTDPDGDALTYAWNFGDGGTAVGSMTSHAYADSGDFAVCLTVADRPAGDPNLLSDTKCTTAHITTELPARVFTVGGNGTIRLASGKPKSCFQIEPVGGDYVNSDVNLPSITATYGTATVSVDPARTAIDSDKDANGVQEITACFTKAQLRILFAGLPAGHNLVTVTIKGNLTTGARFMGTVQVDVVSNGSFSAATASVSPNPLNPASTLYFATSKPGTVKVEMFDLQGRLVRTIVTETFMGAGDHEALEVIPAVA